MEKLSQSAIARDVFWTGLWMNRIAAETYAYASADCPLCTIGHYVYFGSPNPGLTSNRMTIANLIAGACLEDIGSGVPVDDHTFGELEESESTDRSLELARGMVTDG